MIRGLRRSSMVLAGAVLACLPLVPASSAAIGAPVALTPRSGAMLSFQQLPVFVWGSVGGADHYEFQMAADRSFHSLLGRSGEFNTRSTRATLTKTVANGEYWWRVRAVTKGGSVSSWSQPRSVRKMWNKTPQRLWLMNPRAPSCDASRGNPKTVSFPEPLTMCWTPVPWAAKYLVSLATDSDLSTLVNGKPIETSGTTFTPNMTPGTAAKTYYWAVTPVDAEGNKGARSQTVSFSWLWPSRTKVRWDDLRSEEETVDPQFSWDPVPGAAGYELEVNSSQPPDWAPSSRVCCKKLIVGTTYSSTKVFADNTYYWRVRAIDIHGSAGEWNNPDKSLPDLRKVFDKDLGRASIPNLHMQGDPSRIPVVAWDPVPGASAYLVQVAPHVGVCDWQHTYASDTTPNIYWSPLAHTTGRDPFPANVRARKAGRLLAPAAYCVRVRAESDKDTEGDLVYGDFTYLNGSDNPAFTYAGPPCPNSCGGARHLDASAYGSPGEGVVTSRTPLLTWQPSAGASWWVLVAKDQEFHTVVDYAFVNIPAYAPRVTFSDEATHYYWTVLPSPRSDGGLASGDPLSGPAQKFDKRSIVPALKAPAPNACLTLVPAASPGRGTGCARGATVQRMRFEWSPVEGARQYEFEVSPDRDFGKLLDDVKTDSVAYTSNTSYPPDVALYWRVRAETADKVQLGWSETRKVTYHLPAPVASPVPAKADLIPTFHWSSIAGAISYDFHIDYPGGRSKDVNGLPSPAMTAVKFTGPGNWHWRVRANFPGRVHGPWSQQITFTKTIGTPANLGNSVGPTYILLSWAPTFGVKTYRVEISPNPDFHSAERVTTDGACDPIGPVCHAMRRVWFASTLTHLFRTKGRVLYWRVAAQDESGNRGAFSKPRTLPLPAALRASARHR